MDNAMEIRGWRANMLLKELAYMWDAGGKGRNDDALVWLVDVVSLVHGSRKLVNVDGTEVWV